MFWGLGFRGLRVQGFRALGLGFRHRVHKYRRHKILQLRVPQHRFLGLVLGFWGLGSRSP